MAREKETYRANLEALRERFPGKAQISVVEAAKYLGVTKERIFADETFPRRTLGKNTIVVLVNFAQWLAG